MSDLTVETGHNSERPSTSALTEETARLSLDQMDPQLTDIQPGGGYIIRLEQWWGGCRRWYLKKFRADYVARMRQTRQGDENRGPHDVLDPRDLKYHVNQGGYYWLPEDDPFASRDRLPFARVGLAELVLLCGAAFGGATLVRLLTAALHLSGTARFVGLLTSATLIVIGLLVAWFFRDPHRTVPQGEGLVVSPADGKIVTVEEVDHDEFIEGPAVLIGIFLSIFSVHINRMPIDGRVIGLRYRKGKCLNALRPESARENEQLAVRLEGNTVPHRRMVVRQITGAIARRIVCWLKPGDELAAGRRFGMIKLGSRTELVLPREASLEIRVKVGESVSAGSSVLASYAQAGSDTRDPS
jgi:phosphatidylserine decarboxylase